MLKMSMFMFYASIGSAGIALLLYVVFAFARRRVSVARYATSAGQMGRQVVTTGAPQTTTGASATVFTIFAFAFLTVSLILRAIVTGHGPFSNMFEFSLAFAWGIMLSYLYIEFKYRMRTLGVVVIPWALFLMWYATTVPSETQPLVPALQNNLLLTVHVAVAIIAYGTFAVSFGAAVLYLCQRRWQTSLLPGAEVMDEVGYHATIVGFPMMFLVIILGALWADVAWGSYWSWDPKETASLVTWLIYGGYLHARVMRGWRGTRSAIMLIIGFAAVLFTYFGNLFFGGLHSYSGV
jgi:cytochrome c-type biogenesis protein CcsB